MAADAEAASGNGIGRDDWGMGMTHRRTVRGGEAVSSFRLGRVDGPAVAFLGGLRGVFLVGVACGGWRTAQAQPRAKKRVHRKQTNDQRKGKPEGSREEVAHAPASREAEI